MTGIRSVLFDFDGLIANTEPLHFETFLKVLAENDVLLPPGTEQSDFTGIHDRASFRKAFRKVGRSIDPGQTGNQNSFNGLREGGEKIRAFLHPPPRIGS